MGDEGYDEAIDYEINPIGFHWQKIIRSYGDIMEKLVCDEFIDTLVEYQEPSA